MKEYIERTVAKVKILSWAVCIDNPKLLSKEDTMYCIDNIPAADVAKVRHAEWKYYHKQNKAVCTNCSFERDLDADFGRAVACPNCGALMKEADHD